MALGLLEQRQQPPDDLGLDGVDNELPQRALAELDAGGLAPQPLLAVEVEYAVAEEVLELGRQEVALGGVGEARLGYVLDVVRVGGDDVAGQAGGFEGGGLRRAPLRNLDGPFDKAVAVLGQVRKPADDRVGLEVVV